MISRKFTLCAGLFFAFTISFLSCKKINEATTLGDDLIPAVDNITTFDTTLDVLAYNDIFSLTNPPNGPDSLSLIESETHFLGNITSDPLFGTTAGSVFVQLKPSTFRFAFNFKNQDSLIGLDSVVLSLKYTGTYGDTLLQQSVNVFEIDQASDFRYDSNYRVRENTITYTNMLGNRTFLPADLNDSLKLFKDTAFSTANELRIRLNDAFGQRLLSYDSVNAGNNAYASDSIFNLFFKGFAIVPGGTGNGMIGISPLSSKLSIYYKYRDGKDSTVVTDFVFTARSANANYIQRDYAGSQLATYQGGTDPHEFIFLQTQPGTFATINVPGIGTLNNRVIHRAELLLEQASYDPMTDTLFRPPTQLFLDYYDSSTNRYSVPKYDFSAAANTSSGGYSYNSAAYGMIGKKGLDLANNLVTKWSFDISRWVQNIVSGREKYYPLRLYAPYESLVEFTTNGIRNYGPLYPLNPSAVAGRVRLFGGTPVSNPERMRVRIIYSKI